MKLEAQLTAGHHAGRVDVIAFGINEATDYHRLTETLDFIKRQRWRAGPLKPLVEAVSIELVRRRTKGR